MLSKRHDPKVYELGVWEREPDQLAILALDHRKSFRVFLNKKDPGSVTKEQIKDLKHDLVANTGEWVDGYLLDPEVGMDPDIIEAAGDKLIIAALEAQDYLFDPSVTHTNLMSDWNPRLAKNAGAHWVKLMVLWDGQTNNDQEETIQQAIGAATEQDMPLVLEPLPRHTNLSKDWVFDWVGRYQDCGADILRLPYPGSYRKCKI